MSLSSCVHVSFPWDFIGPDGCCNGCPDWLVSKGDLAAGDPLFSAIITQLYARRDWWGNKYMPYPVGSRLHELSGPVTVPKMRQAEAYILEALEVLEAQGALQLSDVTVFRADEGLAVRIEAKEFEQEFLL